MDKKIIQKGDLLICRPNLMQDIFSQSVVLLTEHNQDGTVGLIINRRSFFELDEFAPEIQNAWNFPLYTGGPVEKEYLFFIHNRYDLIPESVHIANGIYWTQDYDTITDAIHHEKIKPNEIKIFLGYSGWAKGQLEEELANNSWYHKQSTQVDVFKTKDEDMWKEHLKEMGGDHLLWMNMPEDPTLN